LIAGSITSSSSAQVGLELMKSRIAVSSSGEIPAKPSASMRVTLAIAASG
jgi:hypothetical protein